MIRAATLALAALVLVGCARPPPGALACAGRTTRMWDRQANGDFVFTSVFCDVDRLEVASRSDAWSSSCVVDRDQALAVWSTARRTRSRDQVEAEIVRGAAPSPHQCVVVLR